MKKVLLFITAYSCFIIGCGNTNHSPGNDTTPSAGPSSEPNIGEVVAPSPMETPATIQSAADSAVTTISPQQQVVSTAKGMNPAHGQPGHRCDIAVGAPLNSPAGVNATAPATMSATPAPTVSTPVGTPTPSPATSSKSTSSSATPPGINPPHGEPGHDCAIAVGAPLKK